VRRTFRTNESCIHVLARNASWQGIVRRVRYRSLETDKKNKFPSRKRCDAIHKRWLGQNVCG